MESTYLDPNSEDINTWAYIEIFGHDCLAGRISTRKLGTEIMFQVDVPKGDTEFSHSEFFSPKSIFSIKPTTEDYCRQFTKARSSFSRQVLPYIPQSNQLTAPQKSENDPPEYDPNSEGDDEPFIID